MKFRYRVNKIILNILRPLPFIGEPIWVLNAYHKIKSLENAGKFVKARLVRKKAIDTVDFKYQGPILRSEGQDRLYRLKDYQGALKAFEKAEIAMDKSAFFYGVSQPDGVLSGIAIAAVRLGDREKAVVYRDKLIHLHKTIKKYVKTSENLKWYDETIVWLNRRIDSIP